MSTRDVYDPGPANLAHIEKNGDDWTLVLAKDLRHSPERVWQALTDPTELHQWAPFDADGNLGMTGAIVHLTTVGAPEEHITESTVTLADAPHELAYNWGDHGMRLKLEASGQGTRLTLWTKIPHNFIAMGAAGWHLCFDVLDSLLLGKPMGRTVGPDAMKLDGWHWLHKEYAAKFGVEMPKW